MMCADYNTYPLLPFAVFAFQLTENDGRVGGIATGLEVPTGVSAAVRDCLIDARAGNLRGRARLHAIEGVRAPVQDEATKKPR